MSMYQQYQPLPPDASDDDSHDIVQNNGEGPKQYKKFGLALLITMVSIFIIAVSLTFASVRTVQGPTNLESVPNFRDIYGDTTIGDFQLNSPSFANNGTLPDKYTCKEHGFGTGLSPPLSWSGAPSGTKDFMVVMWKSTGYSWCVYNISTVDHLDEQESVNGILGATVAFSEGVPSIGYYKYDAPCSSGPGAKTYIFYIFAFSQRIQPVLQEKGVLATDGGINPVTIIEAMKDSYLSVAALMTTFTRY